MVAVTNVVGTAAVTPGNGDARQRWRPVAPMPNPGPVEAPAALTPVDAPRGISISEISLSFKKSQEGGVGSSIRAVSGERGR
jgi:hypothetical protein